MNDTTKQFMEYRESVDGNKDKVLRYFDKLAEENVLHEIETMNLTIVEILYVETLKSKLKKKS